MVERLRGRLDPLSAGAGVVFFAVALAVLLGGGRVLVDNGGWLWPLVLITLGALGIASGRLRGPRDPA
jgi:branched-subunit amino acid permease